MKILKKQTTTYNVQGANIAFLAYLYYKSHYADENTMKLCLFLKDSAGIWLQAMERDMLQERVE